MSNIDNKIALARDFAKRSIDTNINGVKKDDYFMFLISKFLLLKESIIKKDSEHNKIYFNVEENKEYIKAIKYIVDYVRNNGILVSNSIEVVIEPVGYPISNRLKTYIRDFHKIRDTIAHGQYDIDSDNGMIILNNSNLKPGEPIRSNNYVISCNLPISVLELFTYIGNKPKDVYNNDDINEFTKEVKAKRKKYGYSGISNYDINTLIYNYNKTNNLLKIDNEKINYNTYNITNKINNDYIINNDIKYMNTYIYENYDNNIYKIARDKEDKLRKLLKKLLSSRQVSKEEKVKIIEQLRSYGLIDKSVTYNNLVIKRNRKPTKSYTEKLALVIAELSMIMGMNTNPEDTIRVSSVYNYMQLFLSFKHDGINTTNKNNLGKLRISKIKPKYVPGKNASYERKIGLIKDYVEKIFLPQFEDDKDEQGNITSYGKITQYKIHPSSSFRDSINGMLNNHYKKLLEYLASKNIDILTSVRNSMEHGNISPDEGLIKLHDMSIQNNPRTINFTSEGKPEDYYEIISAIDLDQDLGFNFDDFVIEMECILDKDIFIRFKTVIEEIKKINEEALINTLKGVLNRK